jgi:hypothetical protein
MASRCRLVEEGIVIDALAEGEGKNSLSQRLHL